MPRSTQRSRTIQSQKSVRRKDASCAAYLVGLDAVVNLLNVGSEVLFRPKSFPASAVRFAYKRAGSFWQMAPEVRMKMSLAKVRLFAFSASKRSLFSTRSRQCGWSDETKGVLVLDQNGFARVQQGAMV